MEELKIIPVKREIDGVNCLVYNGRDIKAVEWDEPRLKHMHDKCRCTQHDGAIYVYTGRRVVKVAHDEPWKTSKELLRIGKRAVKKVVEEHYAPNEVIL